MSRWALGLLSAVAVAVTVAVVPTGALGGAHLATGHAVTLKGVRFIPGTLNLNRGDTVTWSWRIPNSEHNVTFSGLHSRTGSRGSFAVHFTRTGTFAYRCTVHEKQGMRGKIIVH